MVRKQNWSCTVMIIIIKKKLGTSTKKGLLRAMPCDAWWIFAENGEGDAIVDREYPGEPVQIKTSPSCNASHSISLTCGEMYWLRNRWKSCKKTQAKKVYQGKVTERPSFLLLLLCANVFRPETFFAYFSYGFELSVLWYPYWIFANNFVCLY
jgi:hypothetical protein